MGLKLPFRLLASMLALLAVTSLTACNKAPSWRGQDVTGLMPNMGWELTDSTGKRVRLESLTGEATLLYFGFTNCRDICPTTLSQIQVALDAMGEDGERVRVFLVSVDPERDTPAVMGRYTAGFGPWLLGFTGSEDELRDLNQAYSVDFLAQEPDMGGEYDVMHSNRVFGFDRNGRCRVLMPNTANTEAFVADILELLDI